MRFIFFIGYMMAYKAKPGINIEFEPILVVGKKNI